MTNDELMTNHRMHEWSRTRGGLDWDSSFVLGAGRAGEPGCRLPRSLNGPLISLRSERSAERRLPRRSSCSLGAKPGHATSALRATPWQTLALSPWERESARGLVPRPGVSWRSRGISRTQRTVWCVRRSPCSANGSPLPWGEGQGEGSVWFVGARRVSSGRGGFP